MVQWKDYDVENATWEPKDNVIASFEEEHRMKIQSLDSMSISGPEKVGNRQTAKKFVYCGNCQMPFSLLLRWEYPEVHAGSCLETDFRKVPACPQGMYGFYVVCMILRFNGSFLFVFLNVKTDNFHKKYQG